MLHIRNMCYALTRQTQHTCFRQTLLNIAVPYTVECSYNAAQLSDITKRFEIRVAEPKSDFKLKTDTPYLSVWCLLWGFWRIMIML